MLASFSSFSQNVILSENQAKAVAIDLIAGDACRQELERTQGALELTETKVDLKDKVISNLENQKTELQKINEIRLQEFQSLENIVLLREKELKKQKRVSLFYKIIAVTGVLTSGFLIIK
ncbi:MAG TPA: hypothetical protein VF677_11930 [Flavobacterium sp.]|jgi:hypothetical protein